MRSRFFSCLINIGVGTRNSVIICIEVGEKVVRLGNVDANKLNRIEDKHPGLKREGEGKVVLAAGCPSF